MASRKGLTNLLPSALLGLTEMPWVEMKPGHFFYQVDGTRVHVSVCANGYKVQFEQYENKNLIPAPSKVLASLTSAVQFAEGGVHYSCLNKAFIPECSWLSTPATQPQLDSLRDHMRIANNGIESRWEAQQAMNRYFSRLRQRRRRK